MDVLTDVPGTRVAGCALFEHETVAEATAAGSDAEYREEDFR